jgi:putative hemolysin
MSTLPNPASVYCEQQGYMLEIRTDSVGNQVGICIFPDGSECDEWAFFRGECVPASQGDSLSNPASIFCEQQGYTLEIRTAADNSQAGVCVFKDGSECDEWAYYHGECKPATIETPTSTSEYDSQGWRIYTNTELGYSFHYPAEATVIINDEPLKSLYLYGTGMGSESWGISAPTNREEYHPPEDVDLFQWLTDHYLLGENRQPDVQIAGTTAIHFRHERSPQSYADDRYYLAWDGQLYMILIGHSGDVEDWDLNNRFLQSFQFDEPSANSSTPTPIPTALPIDPTAYQDWTTYTHPVYNFSIRLPDDWIVEEVTAGGPGMDGHILNLHPVDDFNQANIRLTFRSVGENVLLWPTGVGQGDFVLQGTLLIAGQLADRVLLVCPTGEVTSIWYRQAEGQPNITRDDLEFGIIYSAISTHCEPGYTLSGKVQLVGETIIASLQVP